MPSARAGGLLAILSQVPDPRGRKGRRHPLAAMLAAVVCGLLSGARGYESLVEWLHDLPVEFWHFLGFTRKPPQKDAFRDLLMKLEPSELETALSSWIEVDLASECREEVVEGVSIDGKTLCGTLRPFARAVHLLAAVDHRTGCVLSQCRVDEKTNEHKGSLGLLRSLVLKDRVVVGDAIFCQREICEQIVEDDGNYLFAVKENQPGLLRAIEMELVADEAAFSPLRTAATASRTPNRQYVRKGPRTSRTAHVGEHHRVK